MQVGWQQEFSVERMPLLPLPMCLFSWICAKGASPNPTHTRTAAALAESCLSDFTDSEATSSLRPACLRHQHIRLRTQAVTEAAQAAMGLVQALRGSEQRRRPGWAPVHQQASIQHSAPESCPLLASALAAGPVNLRMEGSWCTGLRLLRGQTGGADRISLGRAAMSGARGNIGFFFW